MSKEKVFNAVKVLALMLFFVGGLGVFYWQTSEAKADVPALWGMVDAKEININSKVAGRVIELLVDEGDHVDAGQLIARVDRDLQEPQLRQAQAALAAQYAQLQQVMIASRNAETSLDAQLRAAQAQLTQAQTALDLASKDEARYSALLEAGAVSVQTYDTYKSQLDNALAVRDAAQAAVDSARSDLLKNDQNVAAQLAAQEQAEALKSQLDAVEVNLDETEIRAPFDGIITQKYVEAGQLISSAIPIFALQNPLDNWIDFKVDETAINNFSIGQLVKLRGRDGSTVIDGTVESIRRKADFATQKATSERGDVDVIAFNVKVRTDNPAVWSGMRFALDGAQ